LQKTLRFWKGQGVSGFLFKDASYLVEDEGLTNEPLAGKPSEKVFDEYEFYNHKYTKNLPANVEILSIFKKEMVSDMDDPDSKM